MNKLSNVILKPLGDSVYMKPFRMHYLQDGKEKSWDMLKVHDSVSIVLFNITRKVLIFVKQFRPAVYIGNIPNPQYNNHEIDVQRHPAELGITLELCAGIVDKELSLEEIAKEEILEECGYNVPLSSIERIASYRASVGTSGSVQTAFYCEVTDAMKVGKGGGVGDEIIEVVEMTIQEMKNYVTQSNVLSPASALFNLYWFLYTKATHLESI